MDVFQEKLKIDIEREIGFKILSTTEAKVLNDLLLENHIYDLSLSTIRRFWGLIPNRKPNQKTLNALSMFLGYKTFLDYVTYKNRFEQLYLDEKFQRLKSKDSLSMGDLNFIEFVYLNTGHVYFFVSLFENAVLLKKWNYVEQLLDDSYNKLLVQKDHRNSFLMKFSYLVVVFLNSLPTLLFNTIIDRLLSIEGFKTYVVYIYIDILNINKRYGTMLSRVDLDKCKFEEKIFLELILNLKSFLNKQKIDSFQIPRESLDTLPDILKGRYYGYQILYYSESGDDDKVGYYFNKFKNGISRDTYIINYVHEFLYHLIFAKRFKMIDEIVTEFYDTIMDDQNIHSYLFIFIININEVIFCLLNDNKQKAERLFSQLDLDKIQYGSICDYYLIFYHIIGYHVYDNLNIKERHKAGYRVLSITAKFKRFNDVYLETFFRKVN